jgi:hypothetical protein
MHHSDGWLKKKCNPNPILPPKTFIWLQRQIENHKCQFKHTRSFSLQCRIEPSFDKLRSWNVPYRAIWTRPMHLLLFFIHKINFKIRFETRKEKIFWVDIVPITTGSGMCCPAQVVPTGMYAWSTNIHGNRNEISMYKKYPSHILYGMAW